jgi:hypothetical protein
MLFDYRDKWQMFTKPEGNGDASEAVFCYAV